MQAIIVRLSWLKPAGPGKVDSFDTGLLNEPALDTRHLLLHIPDIFLD